ncbi:MAG TPA: hypothetical protein VL856_12240 [Acidimicrobiia bacterium]|jgi:hypothetical protein|nr:hypothetical protein [Acidimicrobiia bacterium]
MSTTQSAYEWRRATASRPAPPTPDRKPWDAAARTEIDRLQAEIAELVDVDYSTDARAAVDAAVELSARLQVANANLDACNPPHGDWAERALVTFADRRLYGHADAIERGMTYTGDNTLRKLMSERREAGIPPSSK